jgi:hypothetical protein
VHLFTMSFSSPRMDCNSIDGDCLEQPLCTLKQGKHFEFVECTATQTQVEQGDLISCISLFQIKKSRLKIYDLAL